MKKIEKEKEILSMDENKVRKAIERLIGKVCLWCTNGHHDYCISRFYWWSGCKCKECDI